MQQLEQTRTSSAMAYMEGRCRDKCRETLAEGGQVSDTTQKTIDEGLAALKTLQADLDLKDITAQWIANRQENKIINSL